MYIIYQWSLHFRTERYVVRYTRYVYTGIYQVPVRVRVYRRKVYTRYTLLLYVEYSSHNWHPQVHNKWYGLGRPVLLIVYEHHLNVLLIVYYYWFLSIY